MKKYLFCALILVCCSFYHTNAKHKRRLHRADTTGQANFTTDSLGIYDLSKNPVVKDMYARKAAIEKDRMYPYQTDDNLGQTFGSGDAREYQDAINDGVRLSNDPTEREQQIKDYEQERLYKKIAFFSLATALLIGVWVYIRKRPKRVALNNPKVTTRTSTTYVLSLTRTRSKHSPTNENKG